MSRQRDPGEQHRDQDREVPAGYRRMVVRAAFALVRRGMVRAHRGCVGSMVHPKVQPGTELMLVTIDPVAQEHGRHEQYSRKLCGCRAQGEGVSYAVSV